MIIIAEEIVTSSLILMPNEINNIKNKNVISNLKLAISISNRFKKYIIDKHFKKLHFQYCNTRP